jgi:hypothetical protein
LKSAWVDRAAPGVILRPGKTGPQLLSQFLKHVLHESVRSGFFRSGKVATAAGADREREHHARVGMN